MFKKIKRKIRNIFFQPPFQTWRQWLRMQGIEVRGEVNIYGKPYIIKANHATIIMEDGVTLDSNPMHNMAGIVHPCSIEVTGNGTLYIGKNSGMSGALICCTESIHIGANVGLGANVTIYDNDSHPTNPYERIEVANSAVPSKPVQIDDYVWVGANAMILKGVHVGRGAVIGAGSVVTKDVPELTIYAGNPARYVKDVDITEEQRKQLFG